MSAPLDLAQIEQFLRDPVWIATPEVVRPTMVALLDALRAHRGALESVLIAHGSPSPDCDTCEGAREVLASVVDAPGAAVVGEPPQENK